MMHDRRQYKDPERFMPERFLGQSPERDPREIAFGFGRRYHQVAVYILGEFLTIAAHAENAPVVCLPTRQCLSSAQCQ
jgi:hypothetical protein